MARQTSRWTCSSILLLLLLTATSCGVDKEGLVLTVDAQIDDVVLSDVDATDPLALNPNKIVNLTATVTNNSDQSVDVRHIRLEGEMMNVRFVSYDSSITRVIDAGATTTLSLPLDLFDLEGQAHGYLRGSIDLYDADRTRLGRQEFAMDVRGKPLSSMGVVAVLLVLATGISILMLAYGIAARRLSPNRFVRGIRFGLSGLGLGFLITIGFSILRIFPLPASGWLPILLIPTAAAFALGFVAPFGAYDPDEDDDDDEIESELKAAMV